MNTLKNFQFKTWHFGFLFAILLVLTSLLDAMTIANTPKIQQDNFTELNDNTFEAAISSADISYIFFYKENCNLCDKMEYNLNELEAKFGVKAKFYKLDYEKYPSKYNDYHISGIPTVSIYRGKKEIERIMGIVPVSNLVMIHNRIKK
ncbi:MAG: thioredoxin family protein [Dysgonomonas sp.]